MKNIDSRSILFGIPSSNVIHYEIAKLEVSAFESFGFQVITSNYGNSGNSKIPFSRVIETAKNAFVILKKLVKHKCKLVYLNTGLDYKTIIRDFITISVIKCFYRNSKIILKIHGAPKSFIQSRNILKQYVISSAEAILVLSKEERDMFLNCGVKGNKIIITANPLQKSLYKSDSKFKSRFGFSEETKILLFVGRFIAEKGILDLIEACRLLKRNGHKFHLFCLGDGPFYTKVKEQLENFGLMRNVTLQGHIPEKDTKVYYSNCDVVILPTYFSEGFPMAIFQGVAAGKSIITTRIRAAADYLVEYENCLWVKERDPENLYEKISELVKNEKLLKEIGENNCKLADNFTASNIARKLLNELSLTE